MRPWPVGFCVHPFLVLSRHLSQTSEHAYPWPLITLNVGVISPAVSQVILITLMSIDQESLGDSLARTCRTWSLLMVIVRPVNLLLVHKSPFYHLYLEANQVSKATFNNKNCDLNPILNTNIYIWGINVKLTCPEVPFLPEWTFLREIFSIES